MGDSCFHVAYKLCVYNIRAAMFYIHLFSNVCILCIYSSLPLGGSEAGSPVKLGGGTGLI